MAGPVRVTLSLLALALLAFATPAQAGPAVGTPDVVDADTPVDDAFAKAVAAVDRLDDTIRIVSPVDADVDAGVECRPSATSPTGRECRGYVCMRTDGEGPYPIFYDPDGGAGVDPMVLDGAPYGPYTSVYVDSDCGCNGWIEIEWFT